MSRVGRQPITIPAGVEVTVKGKMVSVKGPKGELSQLVSDRVSVVIADGTVTIERKDNEKYSRSDHGLYRTLVGNMVDGVTKGFEKQLILEGVGFKVALNGRGLKMALGFSHDVNYEPAEGVDLNIDGNNIKVSGIDKQLVGQTAAEIRALKKPEPYKGKGIRYADEYIVRKAGKTAGGGE